MAEGDDDKDPDGVKSPLKRPLDHVPLKIIIKRQRPNSEACIVRPQSSSIKTGHPSLPPGKLSSPSKSPKKKPRASSVLPLLLLPKYAEITELMTAFETEKPKSLQEVWHSVRQYQQEEEFNRDTSKQSSMHKFFAAQVCDFGDNCEMPWLHPAIGITSWVESSSKNVTTINKEPAEVDASSSADTGNGSKSVELKEHQECDRSVEEIRFSDWRHGPAKHWYDRMNVPEEETNFSYGFKLKEELSSDKEIKNVFPDDAFLLVTQLNWEDDVIWNGADLKPEHLKKIKTKWLAAGGRENSEKCFRFNNMQYRLPGYLQSSARGRNFYQSTPILNRSSYVSQVYSDSERKKEDEWKSVFENEELRMGSWESEIIWDPENMTQIPRPKIPTLDPNDDNIVLGFPDDFDPSQADWANFSPDCVKLLHPHRKDSKVVIGKDGITQIKEKDFHHFTLEDPFNVSNDSYYTLKSSDSSLRLKPVGKLIQHSIPVLELRPPFIPTHLGPLRLQNFHRIPLKRYSYGQLSLCMAHPVYSLSREISLKAKLREEEREASGGGDVFFMREAEDLSGRDGDLVLVEFSEEHPLLMNEVGMCSKIINYYKRKASKDEGPPPLRFGEVVYPHTSPFLGVLSQGQCIQALENNLYRCPIFEHNIRESDFLVIRTRHSYAIREVDALFVAGQQCPLYEVPAPHSVCARNFTRDFLQVHIYRMFLDCPDRPQWVKMDEIKKAFPDISDINIRKCLKQCSDFKRVDVVDSSCWVLRSDFRLPTEEELRAMVSPEQCCAQFSMMAALQRLKDAGYGGNALFVPPDEEDEEDEDGMRLKIDDEMKAAPWNLTRGFIESVNGKCFLELSGLADPTGCGEGFSYLTRPKRGKKPVQNISADVDSDKPSVANAKVLLKKMGVPDKEIKRLSCWELVDIARSVTKKKMRTKVKTRIPKPRPMTTAELFSKYKDDCQRIFELQNRVLQSNEELSTDEEELSDDDDSDVEEMGKILEKLISNGRSYSELQTENEERERKELVKMMMDESAAKQGTSKDKIKKSEPKGAPQSDRVLKISRTFRDSTGKEYTRVEFVRKSSVIDIYLKIRATKDDAFISQFALESAEKQRIMKEKRSIESQLSRLKQHMQGPKNNFSEQGTSEGWQSTENEGEGKNTKPFLVPPSKKLLNPKVDLKRRCGACGNLGHKKGNKACPLYSAPVNVAMTEEEREEFERQMNVDDQDLVNVDGTKLKLSVKLIKRHEEVKRRSLVLRVPKDIVRKRKRPVVNTRCDYLQKFQKTVNRRRTDPVVVLSNAFESILNEMRDLPDSDPFHFPVSIKTLPHYYTLISRPMDLQTIRENLRQKKYQSREVFLQDVVQIVQNSATFNGSESPFTINAQKMLDVCVKRMEEQEEELIRLEETINPTDEEVSPASVKRKMTPPSGVVNVPNDLDVSESEDEGEVGPGYLGGRECSTVPSSL